MASTLDSLLVELWGFIAPLRRALAGSEQLAEFLERFGYQLDPAVWDDALDDLGELKAALDGFTGALAAVDDPTDLKSPEVAELTARASALFDKLRTIGSAGGQVAGLGIGPELFGEVFDAMLHDYLARRAPVLLPVLSAVEALVIEGVPPTAPGGRQVEYVRIRFDWERFGQFITDNGEWAEEVYGWGVDFRYNKALNRLARILDYLGPPVHFEEIPPAQLAAFIQNVPPSPSPAVPPRHDLVQVRLPIYDEVSPPDANGFATVSGEAGLVAMPFGDLDRRDRMGLALAPYVLGGVEGEHKVAPDLALTLAADAEATGGAVLVVRPGEVTVEGGGAVDARFELGVRYARDDGSEVVLLGEAGGTRLAAEAIVASFGGTLNGDLFLAGGVQKLRLVADLSEDGFLGSLFSGPVTVDAGDLLVGWRPGRGVYFEGGTSLGVAVPLNLEVGPVTITEVGAQLDWAEELAVTFTVSGDATVGPLFAYVEDLGVVATVVPREGGVFGKYDLAFALKPPSGYAVALEAPAIEGGGYLAAHGHEYRGALSLKFQTFGLAAFGILTTRFPDGREGFSFVASIFGEFSLPLGYGFFLTGAGGIVGLNRTTDTDALRAVLFEGRFDNLLFPSDPIANAATILDDMASIFPPSEGQHLFGPVAKIAWGQPTLIEGKLGVIVEIGRNVRLLILGGVASELPTRDAALVSLKLSFFGEIDFAAGTISFDASLATSRVLTWPVSGDAAVRSGWAARLDHIASFGGLHPRYPRPSNLPELRQLAINFGTNNPRVTLSGYAAVTLSSLQFGARADLYAKGPKIPFIGRAAAEGWAYFDALIAFNPFGFDVALGGGLQLLLDGDVVAGLGFDLRLTGPNTFYINGKVWVTVFGVDIDFRIRHRWGTSQSLPIETADPLVVLRQGIREAGRFEPLPARNRIDAVVFASDTEASEAIDPAGGARFVQRALPLGVAIEKVGEAQIAGPFDRFDLKVVDTRGAAVADARLDFVRGHFWRQSEADRLRAPAFEKHRAGFDIASDALTVDASLAVEESYEYEVIEIEVEDVREAPVRILPHLPLEDAFTRRWMYVHHTEVALPVERFRGFVKPPLPVEVRDPVFVTPDIVGATVPRAPGVPGAPGAPGGVGAVFDALRNRLDPAALSLTGMRELETAGIAEKPEGPPRDINTIVADYVAVGTF